MRGNAHRTRGAGEVDGAIPASEEGVGTAGRLLQPHKYTNPLHSDCGGGYSRGVFIPADTDLGREPCKVDL